MLQISSVKKIKQENNGGGVITSAVSDLIPRQMNSKRIKIIGKSLI